MDKKSDFTIIGWVSILYFLILLFIGSLVWIVFLFILYNLRKLLNERFEFHSVDKLIWVLMATSVISNVFNFFIVNGSTISMLTNASLALISGFAFVFTGFLILKISDRLMKWFSGFSITMGFIRISVGIMYLFLEIGKNIYFYQIFKVTAYFGAAIQIILNIILGIIFLKQRKTDYHIETNRSSL